MSGESNQKSTAAPAEAKAIVDVTATVPLDEFCKSLSTTDRRVELIAGFHSDELRNSRHHDTPTAYAARYEAFAGRPV